ncbi:basic helix-loop-helix (bHLH) DNA-binding superfamily protein [Actinidia rufa]|uniref:Basic helix-loop-helix (BHLH) DNA-binding superfamily protein n=1 Tax=Actinidia rufa TaxID=165716 RepID=A0A7J0DTB3_9ERIC|nr:basic helix-loop-helix (bHLH) DNA-binding superfamily protein [Actinidia rufa]
MNRGHVLPVQQMVAGISPSWWSNNMSNMRPPIMSQQNPSSAFLPPPSSNLFPHYNTPPPPLLSSWHDNQELPESWSQLLLGGLVGEEEKSGMSHVQAKKLENWEEQVLHQQASCGEIKQDHNYVYGHGSVDHNFQAPTKPTANWSQMMPASSPTSCVTSLSSNMLDFSNNKADRSHPPPDRSSECNSTATGGALKKARVQPSSTPTTFKVRKEKLGDRITSLHQLVSPFGKTDTASVLLEAIGYIRFLQSQVEALSLPYLGSGSGNMRHQHSVQGERNCLFPEDPGQLLNDNCMKIKGASEQDSHGEPNKDLRSRGLCLVPISSTMQVGSDNGADYWAPALSGGFQSKFC